MRNISINVSGKIDNIYLPAIEIIKSSADSYKIPFLIIGALSRDIIMEYFYGIKAPRLTMGIDIGIKVSTWKDFEKIISTLENTTDFERHREQHRMRYGNMIIDIVPFGQISGKEKTIAWPPQNEVKMTVMGFDEVYRYSTVVKLKEKPVLEIRIPTLPGLTLLKLISWKDGYPNRRKDAEDLLFIMKNYEMAGNFERLYESELSVLESEGFDNQTAGIVLLGRDIKKICDVQTLGYLKEILDEETSEKSSYKLASDMLFYKQYDFERIICFIKKLKEGICREKLEK